MKMIKVGVGVVFFLFSGVSFCESHGGHTELLPPPLGSTVKKGRPIAEGPSYVEPDLLFDIGAGAKVILGRDLVIPATSTVAKWLYFSTGVYGRSLVCLIRMKNFSYDPQVLRAPAEIVFTGRVLDPPEKLFSTVLEVARPEAIAAVSCSNFTEGPDGTTKNYSVTFSDFRRAVENSGGRVVLPEPKEITP